MCPYRGGDRGGDVAVLDELDAGARRADLLHEIVVARAVEDDRGDVVRPPPVGLGDRDDVVPHRLAEVDLSARNRADGDLAHVHLREARERAGLPHADHGHGPVVAARDDRPALERVDGEVDLRPAAPDRCADRERVRLLVAADDDPAGDRELVQAFAHRRRRRLFGALDVAAAEPARTRERGPLGHRSERLTLAARLGVAHAGKLTLAPGPAPARLRRGRGGAPR